MRRGARKLCQGLLVAALAAAPQARGSDDAQNRQQALTHYRSGQEQMRSEHWEEAEREFKEAIKLDPLLTLAHYSLGQTYMATRQYPEAVRAFKGCNEAYMKVASLGISDRALADQRREEEIRELRQSIRLFQSGQVKTLQANAMVLKLENRLQELERTKQRGPMSAEIPAEFSLALGSAYFRSGAQEDAEREYQAAVRANSKLGEAHNNLAVIYMLTGRYPQAHQSIGAAEKAGFKVNPALKDDLKAREAAAPKN